MHIKNEENTGFYLSFIVRAYISEGSERGKDSDSQIVPTYWVINRKKF